MEKASSSRPAIDRPWDVWWDAWWDVPPGGKRYARRMHDTTSRTFVDEDQAQVIPRGVFLVHVSECGRQVESAKEKANGDGFTCPRSARRSSRLSDYPLQPGEMDHSRPERWPSSGTKRPGYCSLSLNSPREGEPSMICSNTALASRAWLGVPGYRDSVGSHPPRIAPTFRSRYTGWEGSPWFRAG